MNRSSMKDHNPMFSSKLITVRTIVEDDLPAIYTMYSNKNLIHLWSPETTFHSFAYFREKLLRRLKHRWHHGVVFTNSSNGNSFGFAYCYNANQSNRNAALCLFVDEPFVGKSVTLQASYLYLKNLFEEQGYLKLYAEVFEYNTRCLKLLRHLGFKQEGCLSKHQRWNEKYWDLHIFMITKEQFEELGEKYMPLIQRVI